MFYQETSVVNNCVLPFRPVEPALQIPCCDTEILFTMLVPLWVCVVKHGCNSNHFEKKKKETATNLLHKIKNDLKTYTDAMLFLTNLISYDVLLCLSKLWNRQELPPLRSVFCFFGFAIRSVSAKSMNIRTTLTCYTRSILKEDAMQR